MIKYSPKSAKALAFLKKNSNDIDIFVEDTKNHNMWLLLLRRILPSGVRLRSVNQLGGRDKVIAACRLDQVDDGRKKLYIIDSDFDGYHGAKKPRLKHLYRLNAYCVENILICQGAMEEIPLICRPDCNEALVKKNFDAMTWLQTTIRDLKPLFTTYALVKSLDPSIATVSFNFQNLIRQSSNIIHFDLRKIFVRVRDLIRKLLQNWSLKKIITRRKEISKRTRGLKFDHLVSGKDYLLPALWLNLCKAFSYKENLEQFKARLAALWTPNREPGLTRRVMKVAAS